MERCQKQIIIIPNEEILEIPDGIYQESFLNSIDHGEKIREFSQKYNLKVSKDTGIPGQVLCFQLTDLGNMIISIENNMAILFVPNVISANQYMWIRTRYATLNSFSVHGFVYEDNSFPTIVEKNFDDESYNPLREIYKKIKSKIKRQKKGREKCYKS